MRQMRIKLILLVVRHHLLVSLHQFSHTRWSNTYVVIKYISHYFLLPVSCAEPFPPPNKPPSPKDLAKSLTEVFPSSFFSSSDGKTGSGSKL